MPSEVTLLLGAEVDFSDLYRARGEAFYHSFDRCLEQLRMFPESGPLISPPYHRLLMPKSKLGIFYALEGRRVFVGAILDLRMSPQRIAERLRTVGEA